jgi:hypothetical protein
MRAGWGDRIVLLLLRQYLCAKSNGRLRAPDCFPAADQRATLIEKLTQEGTFFIARSTKRAVAIQLDRFVALLLLINPPCFVILRLGEESSMMSACGRAPGFFAKPQNDRLGNVHFPEPPNGSALVRALATMRSGRTSNSLDNSLLPQDLFEIFTGDENAGSAGVTRRWGAVGNPVIQKLGGPKPLAGS